MTAPAGNSSGSSPGAASRSAKSATFRLWRGDASAGGLRDYRAEVSEGMVVLDAVHQIQAKSRKRSNSSRRARPTRPTARGACSSRTSTACRSSGRHPHHG